ncbi:hypothetical protein J6590_035806 [Homalodisca vitripennis]|nr:hypothetical protein J6590_035806 [Homalodisca vitripennis]
MRTLTSTNTSPHLGGGSTTCSTSPAASPAASTPGRPAAPTEHVSNAAAPVGSSSFCELPASMPGVADLVIENGKLKDQSSKFIITGDFNIDVLDHTNPLTQRLRDILNSFGLIWSVNTPTRVTATSCKAIDNVVTNIPNASVTVFNAAISDHFAQETTISNFQPEIEHPSSKIKRDTSSENIALLNTFLKNPGRF